LRKGISNTSRTLEYIRSQGWVADKVEQFNPYAGQYGQRKDCFGIIDIIALGENSIIGIQSCGQNFSEHDLKIHDSEHTEKWLQCGGRLLLIGWRKVKLKKGGKAMRWMPRIREYRFISDELTFTDQK
jgi:hypothetical protein